MLPPHLQRHANQDDLALYHYLRHSRGDTYRKQVYTVIKRRLTAVEEAAGHKWEDFEADFRRALALFIAREEVLDVQLPADAAPWSVFLWFYCRQRPVALDKADELPYHYFSRDVLIEALSNDTDGASEAIAAVYAPLLRERLLKLYPIYKDAFKDIHQEAMLALLSRPPSPEGTHTAMLYTYFSRIFFNKAADYHRNRGNQSDNFQIPPEERHSSPTYSDYLMDNFGLNDRLATDEEHELVRRLLEMLDEKCQRLLNLRFMRGLKLREVGELLEHSTDSMGQRVKRCLKNIRKLLGLPPTKR